MEFIPGSRSKEVIQRKREVIRQLLQQGLSITQISQQVRCSGHLVRRVRAELEAERGTSVWDGVERRTGIDRRQEPSASWSKNDCRQGTDRRQPVTHSS